MENLNKNPDSLYSEVTGSGEAVLLIHGGFIQDAMLPITQEPVLSDYKLIRYHRRGYGSSGKHVQGFSIENEADDALTLLTSLGITKVHIIGYSSGGAIATQLALIASEIPKLNVQSLILLEPALYSAVAQNPVIPEFVQIALRLYDNGDRLGAVEAFLSATSGPTWRQKLSNTFPTAVIQIDANYDLVFQGEAQGVEAYRLSKDKAQKIQAPVLLILSEEFGPMASYADTLQQWLPQIKQATIRDANHDLPWKQPRQIADEVNRFITKVRESRHQNVNQYNYALTTHTGTKK